MNVYATVIDSVAAAGADISVSGGMVTITGLSKSIPQKSVVKATRVLAGELLKKYTVTVNTASNSVNYSVSITALDPVSGALRTYSVVYKTPSSGNTTTTVAVGLHGALSKLSGAPFTVTTSTNTVVIQMVTGTPSAQVAATETLCTVTDSTTAQAGTLGIATTGTITGSGTTLPAVGSIIVVNDGTDFYRGIIDTRASDTSATVLPLPPAAVGTGSSYYLVDNSGTYLETSAWAGLVALTAANKYVVYEIDANDINTVGNGARPDFIENKFLIFANAADADVWEASDFDADLATALGVTF